MKIKTFSHFNEAQKMVSLREPTDQEIENAEKYLEEGKDPDWNFKLGYFYIDVSGKYSVYYTLWRDSPMNTHFITNLSTDFQTAVEKAKKASGRIPVIIDRLGTKAGLFQAAKAEILTFGKYRGKTIGDIFVEDPKYILWLNNKYEGNLSDVIREKIKYYMGLYYETVTKKNLEESSSKFVGNIGEKITIEADVYDFRKETNNFGALQYTCKLIDDDGNKYTTYNIGKEVKKGDNVKLIAKVKAHKEVLGIKFTQLFYCKVLRVSNLIDDMKKYNIF